MSVPPIQLDAAALAAGVPWVPRPEWSGRLEDPVPPGAQVKLTGVFLRATGQRTGDEGAKVWSVLHCGCGLCALGHHVAVDEYPIEDLLANRQRFEAGGRRVDRDALAAVDRLLAGYTDAEKSEPRAHPRHVAVANLMPAYGRGAARARFFP